MGAFRVRDPVRRAAPFRPDRSRACAKRISATRAALHGRELPEGEYARSRRIGRARNGGLGLPVFDTALVLEEIAKACYVTAMAVLGEVGVQTRIIATYASEAIKQRILPAVCRGEAILAICMTEPDAGTDVANYKTNADTGGNALKLNGVKTLISRADEAQMFVVFTRV